MTERKYGVVVRLMDNLCLTGLVFRSKDPLTDREALDASQYSCSKYDVTIHLLNWDGSFGDEVSPDSLLSFGGTKSS